MCTAITMRSAEGETFFGRTMDFSYVLDPHVYVMPRDYIWSNITGTVDICNPYGFIGTGQDVGKVIFVDGVNEAGFAAAALYFPGYAHFSEPEAEKDGKKISIAAVEMVNFLLGTCASVSHAAEVLKQVNIVGIADPVTESVAPLHWIAADKSGSCMVIEQTDSGMHLYDNPIGVLTNSPGFEWHMTNLRNYAGASPEQIQDSTWGEVTLSPFGQGAGAMLLPGDYTPPSRFVRTAFIKSHSPVPAGREQAVITCFHIMEGVTLPKGAVRTREGKDDYTQYTAFVNTATGEYFAKSYDNSQIVAAKLTKENLSGTEPVSLGKLIRPVEFASLQPRDLMCDALS